MSELAHEQITVIDTEEISVYKVPSQNLAILVFESPSGNNGYQERFKDFIALSAREGIQLWLIKCSDKCSIDTTDQLWIETEVIPAIINNLKLQKIAVLEAVNNCDLINLMELCQILSDASDVEIQFFEIEENARQWLQQGTNFENED